MSTAIPPVRAPRTQAPAQPDVAASRTTSTGRRARSPARSGPAASAPQRPDPPIRSHAAERHGRSTARHRTLLTDLVAGIAGAAAVFAVLTLATLPGSPVGVALAVAAVASVALGAATLAAWARSAVRDGASVSAARRRATVALLAAHAVAAVPVGLAVLLAG